MENVAITTENLDEFILGLETAIYSVESIECLEEDMRDMGPPVGFADDWYKALYMLKELLPGANDLANKLAAVAELWRNIQHKM
jgi:hypothetical protein